ncbi:MAG: hypothetical protein KH310_07125 [Enterobacteriaceae bacterium]|nr:hypothetical protein [Enterobacteriaceae bacterium]
MKIGKIIKNISFTFSIILFSVLAPSAIDNHIKQKNGENTRIKINILFQTLKNFMIIIATPKIWQHTILPQNGNVIMERNF